MKQLRIRQVDQNGGHSLLRLVAGVCAAFAAVVSVSTNALAGSYYLKSASADWSQAESFATSSALSDSASTPPGADDDVYLLANTDVSLASGTASFSTAAAVGRIVPQSGSRLLLTVDGDATFDAKINNGLTLAANDPYGEVVKLGDGVLTLTATSTIPSNANLDFTYYIASFVVAKGTLKFPQHGCAQHFYYGDVTVSNNATLYMPLTFNIKTGSAISSYMRMRSLCGDGLVTVDASVTKVARYIYLEKYESSRRVSFFNGVMSGAYVHLTARAGLTVTNNASSFDGIPQVQDGYGLFGENGSGMLTTTSFGTVNKSSPVGKGQFLSIGNYGGGFRYLGNGESTDKQFLIAPPVGSEGIAFLDAGPNGGVTFTGEFKNSTETEKHLVLMGSNTAACVLANSWTPSATGGYPIFTTKRGSGTWRFADVASRNNLGGFAVEDGVLQFASISNIGERCSLGTATYLTRPMTGVPTDADKRVYAHTIGSTDASANAVFDYVGRECAIVTNRPTVIVGKGAIRSSATDVGYLALSDVSPRDGAAVTLVLDGTNTNHNLIRDIYDGTGTVSVVKRGSGEWALSGDTTFSGALRVEEGTLTVYGPRYTWFRLSVMQAGDGADANTGSTRGQIVMKKIALYDSDGVLQNADLAWVSPHASTGDFWTDSAWQKLQPGSAETGRPGKRNFARDHDLDVLFSSTKTDSVTIKYKNDADTDYIISVTNDPSTWISFVMRLTNGVPEIAAYDIQTFNKTAIGIRWPKHVRMEGSRDGVKWDWLGDHEFDFSVCGDNSDRWLSDGSTYTARQVRKGKGVALTHGSAQDAFVLSNVTSVAVSSGAVLRTFDDVTLSSIEVDCNDCGTIQGFSLAESGTLNIVNAPKSPTFTLPNFLSGVSNAENLANWTLKIGGAVKKNWEISVSGTEVKISGPGFLLMVL